MCRVVWFGVGAKQQNKQTKQSNKQNKTKMHMFYGEDVASESDDSYCCSCSSDEDEDREDQITELR